MKKCYLVTTEYFDRHLDGQNWVRCYVTKEEAVVAFWDQIVKSGAAMFTKDHDHNVVITRSGDGSFITFYDDSFDTIKDGEVINCGDCEIGFKIF